MSGYAATYEKGFEKPVGLHMWKSIGDELKSLNDDLHKKYNGSGPVSLCITEALNIFNSEEKISIVSNDIKLKMEEASRTVKSLSAQAESVSQIQDSIDHLKVNEKIFEFLMFMGKYDRYHLDISWYVENLKKWNSCALSNILTKPFWIFFHNGPFTKKIAGQICEQLGATLEEHLQYIDTKDIEGLVFLDKKDKLKLQSIVEDYKEKNNKSILPMETVKPIRASLAELRACFESSDNEE